MFSICNHAIRYLFPLAHHCQQSWAPPFSLVNYLSLTRMLLPNLTNFCFSAILIETWLNVVQGKKGLRAAHTWRPKTLMGLAATAILDWRSWSFNWAFLHQFSHCASDRMMMCVADQARPTAQSYPIRRMRFLRHTGLRELKSSVNIYSLSFLWLGRMTWKSCKLWQALTNKAKTLG